MSKSKELSQEQLALLNQSYPVSDSNSRASYPRFGMLSKDIVEESGTGKNKKITIVEAAGTFYTEEDNGEVDPETGKKVWTKTYLSDKVEVIIAFHRKQLRLFDKSLNKFISSPIYDTKDQLVPLYLDRKQIGFGTPAELQAKFPAVTESGKKSSKLKEETLLYVIHEGTLYQWQLSQSSKWSFKDYSKGLNPSSVVTELSSIEETNGSNTYRKATFVSKGMITQDDFDLVQESQTTLKAQVVSDAEYFLKQSENKQLSDGQDKALDEMVENAKKALD